MAYSLLKIGEEYTAPTLESNLPHEANNDFSVTQIEKVLPLKDRDKVVELVEAETITPEMSCKEIEKIVKSLIKKDEPKELTNEGESKESTETVEVNEVSLYDSICSDIRELFDNTNKESEQWKTYVRGFMALLAEIDN